MTFYELSENKTDSRQPGCTPMFQYVQDMRMDAVRNSKEAFEKGRKQIYLAMTVLYDIMEYVKENSLLALSDDEFFREGKPYVLDIIEQKEHSEVPLRKYLKFGLEIASSGESPEILEDFMVSRYYANRYDAKDALTACIYCVGLIGMIYGICFRQLLKYFVSFIPDEEECTFYNFAEEKQNLSNAKKYQSMCKTLVQKFNVWDAAKNSLLPDRYNTLTFFNELLGHMDDENMKNLLPDICNADLCYSLLAVSDSVRKRMMGLMSPKLRFILMEDLTRITFNRDAGAACMESVGRIMNVWLLRHKDIILERT